MKTLLFILTFCSITVYSQDSHFIKSEKVDRSNWNYYFEQDSSVKIIITDLNGKIIEERGYTDMTKSVEHGKWIEYYSNGNIKQTRYFEQGEPVSIWENFMKNGSAKSSVDYDFDLVYSNTDISVPNQNSIITDTSNIAYVTKMPKFNEGDLNTFRQYVQQNLRIALYNFDKYNGSGENMIYVEFTVDSTGSVTDVKVNDHDKKYMEKEAVRCVRNSPKWTPGYYEDKPLNVEFIFPVVFVYP